MAASILGECDRDLRSDRRKYRRSRQSTDLRDDLQAGDCLRHALTSCVEIARRDASLRQPCSRQELQTLQRHRSHLSNHLPSRPPYFGQLAVNAAADNRIIPNEIAWWTVILPVPGACSRQLSRSSLPSA